MRLSLKRGEEEYFVAPGHEWFWPKFEDKSWEPETFNIFDKILKPETVMLDIGAWIGPTALYAARRAKKVFAFEPDPIAYARLCQNIELNGVSNVVPYTVAVAPEWGLIPFGAKTGYGDSMSSQIWADKEAPIKVPAISLDSVIGATNPTFIKIDIEGGEKFIFEGSETLLKHYKPTIHLSLHTPDMMDDLDGFKLAVMKGLSMYPFIYDENLNRINIEIAFDPKKFNSIVASFIEIV